MKRLLCWATLFLSSSAFADYQFYFDPGLGLITGSFTQDRTLTGVGSDFEQTDTWGGALGVKTGLEVDSILFGLDFTGGPVQYEPNDGRIGTSSWMFLGPEVGFHFEDFPIRFWAGYSLMSRYKINNEPGNTRLYKGSAWKIGTGIHFRPISKTWPKISLNVEYVHNNYGSARGLDGGQEEQDHPISVGAPAVIFFKPKMNVFIFSISFPIFFGGETYGKAPQPSEDE